MVAKDPVDDRKNLGLVALHDLAERKFIASLDAPHQSGFFAILMVHSGPGADFNFAQFGGRPLPDRRKWNRSSEAAHKLPSPTQAKETGFQSFAKSGAAGTRHFPRTAHAMAMSLTIAKLARILQHWPGLAGHCTITVRDKTQWFS